MSFELAPVENDIRKRVGSQWAAYSGMCALDRQTSDCLYFSGRDVLDPNVPSSFVFLTNNRSEHWSIDTLEPRYAPKKLITLHGLEGGAGRTLFVVLHKSTPLSPSLSSLQEKVSQAMRTLTNQPDLKLLFISIAAMREHG